MWMYEMFKLTIVFTLVMSDCRSYGVPHDEATITLLPDSEVSCCSEEYVRRFPAVYCYYGNRKTLTNVWQTVAAFVDMQLPAKYDIYEGADESEVRAKYESSRSSWGFTIFNWGSKSVVLNPFNTTCLAIKTTNNYTLKLKVTQVNKILVGMFLLGALLFFLAPVLVHNQVFYYVTGITVGVLTSVLVLLYFILTLLPLKRPALIGIMAGGSTVLLYFFQSLVNNIVVMMPVYTQFVYGYLALSGFISFVVCYRFGPLTNPRSKNIIQFQLQILSLILVFYSSYNQEATVMLNVVILLLYKIPVVEFVVNVIKRKMSVRRVQVVVPKKPTPPRPTRRIVRYLTVEEYRAQGRVETERGLAEIREYCKTSPQSWAVISSRSQGRFARFISGESHVTKEEVEAKAMEELLTDDEE